MHSVALGCLGQEVTHHCCHWGGESKAMLQVQCTVTFVRRAPTQQHEQQSDCNGTRQQLDIIFSRFSSKGKGRGKEFPNIGPLILKSCLSDDMHQNHLGIWLKTTTSRFQGSLLCPSSRTMEPKILHIPRFVSTINF